MSLASPQQVQRWTVGILTAKNLDDPEYLSEMVGGHLDAIGHVYTNGANQLVSDFARENGIPCTVIPIQGRGLPASTRDIVDACQFVYVVGTSDSKSAGQIAEICAARAKRDPSFAWRVVVYEPIDHWRKQACQVREILEAMPAEDRDASPFAAACWKVVGK